MILRVCRLLGEFYGVQCVKAEAKSVPRSLAEASSMNSMSRSAFLCGKPASTSRVLSFAERGPSNKNNPDRLRYPNCGRGKMSNPGVSCFRGPQLLKAPHQ